MSIQYIPCAQDLSASFSYLGNCLSVNGILGATESFSKDLDELLKEALNQMHQLNLITGSDKKQKGNSFDFNACVPKLLGHLYSANHFKEFSAGTNEAILNLYIYRFWLKERMLRRELKTKQTKDLFIELLKRITRSIILSNRWLVLYFPRKYIDFLSEHSVIKLEFKDRHSYKINLSHVEVYKWLYEEHFKLPDYVAFYIDNRDNHVGCSLLYHPFVCSSDPSNLVSIVRDKYPYGYMDYNVFRAGVSIHFGDLTS